MNLFHSAVAMHQEFNNNYNVSAVFIKGESINFDIEINSVPRRQTIDGTQSFENRYSFITRFDIILVFSSIQSFISCVIRKHTA